MVPWFKIYNFAIACYVFGYHVVARNPEKTKLLPDAFLRVYFMIKIFVIEHKIYTILFLKNYSRDYFGEIYHTAFFFILYIFTFFAIYVNT